MITPLRSGQEILIRKHFCSEAYVLIPEVVLVFHEIPALMFNPVKISGSGSAE